MHAYATAAARCPPPPPPPPSLPSRQFLSPFSFIVTTFLPAATIRLTPASSFSSPKPLLSPHTTASTTTASSTSSSTMASSDSNRPSRKSAVSALKESTDLLDSLSRFKGVLQVQDLNIVLRHFGDLERWSEIFQLFEWMKQHEKLNLASYSSFFKYMGKSQNPIKALQIYNGITDKSIRNNVSVSNSILGCLLKNQKFEISFKLFDQMKQDGLNPDLVTYSTLLSGCTKIKDGYSKAMQLTNELKSNGLYMDSVIYGTLLAICASNKLCEEAELYFQQMKAEGLHPNPFHYSSLLNAYSVHGDYLKADSLIKDMKSAGLVPNKVILTTLLKVYVKGGLFEKSKQLLSELEALGFAGEEMPYCLLMDSLAKAGHVQEAKAIFEEMNLKNIKSDGYSYSIMISAFCRSRLLEEAKRLALEFEVKYNKYDLVMLNTLLRAYCNTGDMESAIQTLRKMDELRVSPDWNTFHILIKYFCREKMYHLAYRTVEDMYNKGHQLNEELCSFVIIQLSEDGAASDAFSVYNMLRHSKRTVSKSLHEKMLSILVEAHLLKDAYVVMKDNMKHISEPALERFALSFMKSGNINLINDVMKAFSRAGRRIKEEVFSIAISRYIAKPEKKGLLLQLLQWMSGHGYVVDSSSRNLLLKYSHTFGQKHSIAEILSKQHVMSRKLKKQGTKG